MKKHTVTFVTLPYATRIKDFEAEMMNIARNSLVSFQHGKYTDRFTLHATLKKFQCRAKLLGTEEGCRFLFDVGATRAEVDAIQNFRIVEREPMPDTPLTVNQIVVLLEIYRGTFSEAVRGGTWDNDCSRLDKKGLIELNTYGAPRVTEKGAAEVRRIKNEKQSAESATTDPKAGPIGNFPR